MGELLLLTCCNYYSSRADRTVSLQARTCLRIHVAMRGEVSTYCRLGISTLVSESESTASGASTDDKTATIQYTPVTSLTGNSNARAHYEQSHGYDQTSHALSNIHGLYGHSYPNTVWTRVSCQAVSPTNALGMRLVIMQQSAIQL